MSTAMSKPATLARRKRIQAHFQAFTIENYEKDLAELINGPKEDDSLPLIQRPPSKIASIFE